MKTPASPQSSNPYDSVCRYIEANAHEALSLSHLAEQIGVSASHFQRQFKAHVGLSPKHYQTACRLKRLKDQLRQSGTITEAVMEAGFGSSSRVYETLDHTLGMTPNHYRRGGEGLQLSYAYASLSIGIMLIAATDRGLCFLHMGDNLDTLKQALYLEFPKADLSAMPAEQAPMFDAWIVSLEAFLSGNSTANVLSSIPLDVQGTAFQHKVWRYLQGIPAGHVRTYREVAEGIGQPSAARAVARACATNTIALLIPCHRVIRGDGQLSGYRWGVERKRALLTMEQKGTP